MKIQGHNRSKGDFDSKKSAIIHNKQRKINNKTLYNYYIMNNENKKKHWINLDSQNHTRRYAKHF